MKLKDAIKRLQDIEKKFGPDLECVRYDTVGSSFVQVYALVTVEKFIDEDGFDNVNDVVLFE